MNETIQIPGLRGSIYKRGKNSYRVNLSLGRNAQGKYDIKRETIRGTLQDAINLLARWNVEYLDNTILPSNHQTIRELYEQWIEEVRIYLEPNTYDFYRVRWECYILDAIGHKRLSDVKLADLQRILREHITQDRQIKNAMSPFFTWCVAHKKIKENPCVNLRIKSKTNEKTEEDIWTPKEVKEVYSRLTFDNLYDIFIVLGVECGMRPQEILGLKWDKVFDNYIAIERAVKKREPGEFILGPTKTASSRRSWPLTPFVKSALELHRQSQLERKSKNKNYVDNNLVVADANGNVPCLRYIGRYLKRKAAEAGVKQIPPKNLRATWMSLMNAAGVPLGLIQKGAGHERGSDVTVEHYLVTYSESLRGPAMLLHEKLHEK